MATFTTAQTGDLQMDLILSVVQEELIRKAKLRPTIMDLSSRVSKGDQQVEVPRYDTHFADPADQNPDGVTATTAQTVNFTTDVIALDKWKTLNYEIPDRISIQSRVNLEAELAASAGRTFGKYMDDEIITSLKAASAAAPDHIQQLSGGTNDQITLADISKAGQLLDEADVSDSDRFLLVSPKQSKHIIDLDDFHNADKYGSREALLNGEVGQIYGFRVIKHNGLGQDEAIAYQREAVAMAVQKEMKFETRRANLGLQKTEYAFSMGWGLTVMEAGVKQVLFNTTGA